MDKAQLKRYKHRQHELKKKEKRVRDLRARMGALKVSSGKVMSSMNDFPFTRTWETVETYSDPVRFYKLRRELGEVKGQIRKLKVEMLAIERWIDSICDDADRELMHDLFIKGRSQSEVARELGVSQQRVSQMIDSVLDYMNG